MTEYEFSIIKYYDDIVRDEPVNIGVFVLNVKKRILYRKFTTNFPELSKRLGKRDDWEYFKNHYSEYKRIEKNVKTTYLWKYYYDNNYTIQSSKPILVKSDKNIIEFIEFIYDIHISIPEKQ